MLNKEIARITDVETERKLYFKPCVVILSGPPLMGKSRLANEIAGPEKKPKSNFTIIDVDDYRLDIDPNRKKYNPATGEISISPPALLLQEQEFAIMELAYNRMCYEAAKLSIEGKPVILPATFSRAEFKQPLIKLKNVLGQGGIPLRVFELHASREELIRRIEKRKTEKSLSNIDSWEKLKWALDFFKSIDFIDVTHINTENPEYVEKVLSDLQDLRNG